MQNDIKAKTTSLVVLLLSVFLLSALAGVQFVGKVSAAGPNDWPMFRHDLQHTGYSTSPAPNTNQTLWTYTTSGVITSSPAVADGKVYVGSADNRTYCLNAATGALVWNYTTGALIISCPAVADGKVYVGSNDNKTYCLDAATGALIWNYTTRNAVLSSPAVADGKVYVGSLDKNVYCLDAATGTLIWNYTTGDQVLCSPAVAGGKVYVGSMDDKVYCLNALNGALVWNFTTGGIESSCPAVAGGKVYVGSTDKNVYCLDAATGTLNWNYTTNGMVISPAVAGDKVYVGSYNGRKVYCLDATTGTHVWNYTTGNNVYSSPAVADGKVYVGSNDNNMYCLDATTGTLIWKYTVGGWVSSSPAVANGVVYVGSNDKKVYAFSAPAITLTPTSQAPGASVSVSGTNFGATKAVGIGFGVEVNVINEIMPVTGPFDVGTGPYIGYLSHLPIKPGTFTMSESFSPPYTTFTKMFDDAGNGTLIKASAVSNASIVNATMNYVTGQFAVFTSGIAPNSTREGYRRIVNYTYYQFNVTPAAGLATSAAGAFQAAITVPSIYNGTHTVTAIDTQGNTATAVLTVTGSAVKPPMWSKTYGGEKNEALAYPIVIQTSDGGYLMTGDTQSYGAGSMDAWLVKTDAAGNMQWSKTYGGPLDETACGIWKTSDGGYAVIAKTNSYGAGGNDFWLLKIDAAGNLQWNKTYGGSGDDTGYDVRQTADGGYVLLGYTASFGAGGQDVWIIKTDGSGNMQWNKTFGTEGPEQGGNLILTADGGYTIPSYSASGGFKSWLIKLDQFGNMMWNKTYSVGTVSYAYIGIPTTDGGYALTGVAYIGGDADFWFIKTDSAGNMLWNRTYGGTGNDQGGGAIQTEDGGYAILGSTTSFGAGGVDAWLIRTDSSGNMLWNRTYGGSVTDILIGRTRTSDGGYAMVGRTYSFGAGGSDLWLVKTDAAGVLPYKAPPAATAFSSVSVLPGWTWTFFVHSNGGVGKHTYQWYEETTLLPGQTSMVLSVAKNTPGTYTFYCKVTDSEGTSANSNTVILTVLG